MTYRAGIRFGRLKPLFALLGWTDGRSYVEVSAERVRVRMGWAFDCDVPRSSIQSVVAVRNALSIGVHGWRGRWLVNGAAGPLVELAIRPPAPGRTPRPVGVPIHVRELTVSVDDVDALIRSLDSTSTSRSPRARAMRSER